MKRIATTLLACSILLVPFGVLADDELEVIEIPHLGGTLAVSMENLETVFYMEKDGKQRFHIVWKGNAAGTTIQGAEAAAVWKKIKSRVEDEFIWVAHMGGALGVARDAVTSLFFMSEKDGKAATLRINYGSEYRTLEGAEALAIWKSLSR